MSEVKNQLKLSREAEAAFRVEPKTFFCLFSETRKNRQNPKTRSKFFLKVEDLGDDNGDDDDEDNDDNNDNMARQRPGASTTDRNCDPLKTCSTRQIMKSLPKGTGHVSSVL